MPPLDHGRTRQDGADADAMSEIERMLSDLMVSNNWSKTKLKAEVRERGICLRNGKEYGTGLPRVLKKNPNLIVAKGKAKQSPLTKMCLVETH